MTIVLKRASRLPFAPIVAALFATAAAVLVMAAPVWILERSVNQIGLSSILPAAAPPLGMKARALLALLALFGTGVVSWIVAMPLARIISRPARPRGFDVQPYEEQAPVRNRSITEAPAERAPIFADRELGAPFMSKEALSLAPVASEAPIVLGTPVEGTFAHAPEDEAPLTLGANWLVDGLPFAPEPKAVPTVDLPYAFEPEPAQDDFRDVPGLELEPEAEDEDLSHANAPFATPVAEQPYSFEPASIAPSIPVAAPAAPGQETIDELILRLENGLDQLTQHTAASTPPVATPIALREALGRLERLAASNR